MIGAGFDIAHANATRHREGLAHSFNNAILWLDYEQSGFPYPVVLFHVNCYGNSLTDISQDETGNRVADMSPPSPSPKRCFEIGRATAELFADSPCWVALIASSSWSHATPPRRQTGSTLIFRPIGCG